MTVNNTQDRYLDKPVVEFRMGDTIAEVGKLQRKYDLTPEEVAKGLAENRMLLVDVREPNEIEAEAYPDAVVVPLSALG